MLVSELRFTQTDHGGLEFWIEAKRRWSLDRTHVHYKSRCLGSAAHYVKKAKACQVATCFLHWLSAGCTPDRASPLSSELRKFLSKNSILLWKPQDNNISDWSLQIMHVFRDPFTIIYFRLYLCKWLAQELLREGLHLFWFFRGSTIMGWKTRRRYIWWRITFLGIRKKWGCCHEQCAETLKAGKGAHQGLAVLGIWTC